MTPRQARIGADLFTAAMAASVGVGLAGLTWRFMGDPGTRYGAEPVAARPARPVDVTPIIATAPFGSGGTITSGGAAPATNQPLELRGIFLAEPRNASTALIQIGDAPPAAFAAGQSVGAARIDAIEVDHVVLIVGGQRQSLGFPQRGAGQGSATATANVSPSPTAPAAPASVPSANGFLQSLGVQQVGDSFRIGDAGSSIGRLAGLQPGDQVERINGRGVADLARDPNAYSTLSTSGAARIELIRGGQRLTLIVPLR